MRGTPSWSQIARASVGGSSRCRGTGVRAPVTGFRKIECDPLPGRARNRERGAIGSDLGSSSFAVDYRTRIDFRTPGRDHFAAMAVTDQLSFTISLEPVEDGWFMARIEEFPEVITAGPTRDEARLMALDALKEYLASDPQDGAAPGGTSAPTG